MYVLCVMAEARYSLNLNILFSFLFSNSMTEFEVAMRYEANNLAGANYHGFLLCICMPIFCLSYKLVISRMQTQHKYSILVLRIGCSLHKDKHKFSSRILQK